MNKPDISLKKVKKLIKLGQFDKLYRSLELERKYQDRNKNFDFVNKGDKSYEWKLNNYSYQWEKGIEHWILWFHGDWKELEANYTKHIPVNYSLVWINPPTKRSISNLPHTHVLVRKLNKINSC